MYHKEVFSSCLLLFASKLYPIKPDQDFDKTGAYNYNTYDTN